MKTLFPTNISRTGYLLFSVLPGGQHIRSRNTALVQLVGGIQDVISSSLDKTQGAFHLVKISGISGSAVNRTRFVGLSHWKIPRKSGKSKKVVPFSRLEFPNGMSCSIYVSRSLYQFQVHGRAPPRTGVYDQMEQLFTNRKFHFCYHRNFRVFFLNGKRPQSRKSRNSLICTYI